MSRRAELDAAFGREADDVADAVFGEANRRLAAGLEDLKRKHNIPDEEESSRPVGVGDSVSGSATATSLESELEILRKQRMAQLKARQAELAQHKKAGHGELAEVVQDEFLPAVTGSKKVVCHFYHREFIKCDVMDKHLKILAAAHMDTKFIKINAEKAPFFVQKLAVRVLPTVIVFHDGVADPEHRLTGFEGLGGVEDFKTKTLALRLGLLGEEEAGADTDSVVSDDSCDEHA